MYFIITLLWVFITPLIGHAIGDLFCRYLFYDPMMEYAVMICSLIAAIIFYIEFCLTKRKG